MTNLFFMVFIDYMIIPNIQMMENRRVYSLQNSRVLYPAASAGCTHATFMKSVNSKDLTTDVFTRTKPPENVSFSGGITYISNTFETRFPKTFFKKLAAEHLPCAYTGIEMGSRADYDALKEMHVLQKRSLVAIKFLKNFKNNMAGVEKEIFNYLEMESKKHPDLKLQELLQLKYTSAEKTLITQQSNVLNKINLIARKLPKNDYLTVRKLVQASFDKIFAQEPLPEERFSRKTFLYHLKKLDINDVKIKSSMLKTAEKLPQSSNSFNAFIVKYSQPYKVRYMNDKPVRLPRDSEELGLRLLEPMLATDEHIYPQELYKLEEQARQKGEKSAKDLSDFRVTILTAKFINEEKGNMLFDDFIKKSKYNVKENIQNHINALTNTCKVWMKKGRIEDSAQLADYIQVLKSEFEMRSKLVTVDISELEKILPDVQSSYNTYIEKLKAKKLKKEGFRKSIKRVDSADNNHNEHYMSAGGRVLENRKIQKHSSRFSHK